MTFLYTAQGVLESFVQNPLYIARLTFIEDIEGISTSSEIPFASMQETPASNPTIANSNNLNPSMQYTSNPTIANSNNLNPSTQYTSNTTNEMFVQYSSVDDEGQVPFFDQRVYCSMRNKNKNNDVDVM